MCYLNMSLFALPHQDIKHFPQQSFPAPSITDRVRWVFKRHPLSLPIVLASHTFPSYMAHILYKWWKCSNLHIKASSSFICTVHLRLSKHRKMLGAHTARLSALHWALWHHHSLQQPGKKKTARRPRRQPITGLVSLQHLDGDRAIGQTWLQAAGRKHTSRLYATRNYGFVKLTKEEVEDYVTRWIWHTCFVGTTYTFSHYAR